MQVSNVSSATPSAGIHFPSPTTSLNRSRDAVSSSATSRRSCRVRKASIDTLVMEQQEKDNRSPIPHNVLARRRAKKCEKSLLSSKSSSASPFWSQADAGGAPSIGRILFGSSSRPAKISWIACWDDSHQENLRHIPRKMTTSPSHTKWAYSAISSQPLTSSCRATNFAPCKLLHCLRSSISFVATRMASTIDATETGPRKKCLETLLRSRTRSPVNPWSSVVKTPSMASPASAQNRQECSCHVEYARSIATVDLAAAWKSATNPVNSEVPSTPRRSSGSPCDSNEDSVVSLASSTSRPSHPLAPPWCNCFPARDSSHWASRTRAAAWLQ
mmetsp:Transcript_88985/g.203537  ORF Transcript_88985/g.203537 Transcript_88985/m.203537 type:complete len:330 (-) Transcript_88985:426-1415(-)